MSPRQAAATAVNTLQVQTNFEIGRQIIEHEQKGAKRASYGIELLNVLSAELSQEFGSGFSATNLKLMRQLFVEFSGRIGQTVSDQSAKPKGLRATSSSSTNRFALSWSHYVLLLTIRYRWSKQAMFNWDGRERRGITMGTTCAPISGFKTSMRTASIFRTSTK